MLRMCVLTVFTETDSSRAISGLEKFVGRYRSTLSSLGLRSSVGGGGGWSLAITDEPCGAVENIVQRAESSGRIAFGEADQRRGVTDLTQVRSLVSERRKTGSGFAGHPQAGLGGQRPAGQLARQCVPACQLRLQAFSRAEFLERLAVPAAAGVEHPGRHVQQLADARAGVCLQGPCGALQPSLAFVELTRPDHVGGQRYQRGCDDRMRVPAVAPGKRYRLVAAAPGSGERVDPRRETELREAADLEIGPTDLPGQNGALLQVAFSVFKPQGPRLDDPQVVQRHRSQDAAERDVFVGLPGYW